MDGWNRESVVAAMREAFAPLESQLKTGDALDYERLYFFSGWLNGSWENVIIIPLTYESPSFIATTNMGVASSWADYGELPLHGMYALAPQESFRDLEADTPYLLFASDWDKCYSRDAAREYVRDHEITWMRNAQGTDAMEYLVFRGNVICHGTNCAIVTSNQK